MNNKKQTEPHGDVLFHRQQVDAALVAAGDFENWTDDDIRRLTNLQFEMAIHGLTVVDGDTLDAETLALLTRFVSSS